MSKLHRQPHSAPWDDPRMNRLIEHAFAGAEILKVSALKGDTSADLPTGKDAGYGAPLRIDLHHEGQDKSVVLHSATANPFGHEFRADRAAGMLIAADTFNLLPHHARVFDVGAFRGEDFVSLRNTGEFYLLTEYAEGRLYAQDLREIAECGALRPQDFARLDALVRYLVSIHSIKLPEKSLYTRSIRDLLGSGEGIFGIIDGYPEHVSSALLQQLERIELKSLGWRWRLKHHYQRLVRIHGDFHPFNVLFDESSELRLLDASRGSAGDAANDVAALAVNYLFFALDKPQVWRTAFQPLWRRFWREYLEHSRDTALLEVVAPFIAWRCLVLASPVWYPNVSDASRTRLLDFVERALEQTQFSPELAESVFRCE
ncbi:MAG: aminoglycoside phosphotransferase family protein [Pseudomonadota bacterium]